LKCRAGNIGKQETSSVPVGLRPTARILVITPANELMALEQHGLFNERHDVHDDQWPAEIAPVLHCKEVHHENCAGVA